MQQVKEEKYNTYMEHFHLENRSATIYTLISISKHYTVKKVIYFFNYNFNSKFRRLNMNRMKNRHHDQI